MIKNDNVKNRFLSVVKWLWLLLVIAGAIYYFYDHQEEITRLISELSPLRIASSLGLLLLGKALIVLLVQFSIKTEGWDQNFSRTIGLYGITSMGKYIPGGVWHFVGRISAYRLKGLNAKQITRVLILENYWLLSSAIAFGLLAIIAGRFNLITDLLNIPATSLLQIGLAVIVIVTWAVSLFFLKSWMGRRTLKPLPSVPLIMVVGVSLWSLIGASFFVMFSNTDLSTAPLFGGGYAISWAIGYLAVFAPGGLGVREAVLAWLFASVAPVEFIAVYAAMNRIIWLVAELFYGLIGLVQKQEILVGNAENKPRGDDVDDSPSHEIEIDEAR
ncbi:MAG: hypothetical protein GXY37_01370 [Chloroflexi bacterium]|nr:hypothetical protein [Chloroflexota bacterium]